MSLVSESCEACRVGASQVTGQVLDQLLGDVPEWGVIDEAGIKKIRRQYTFRNFVLALEFTNKVGQIAEENGHHPDLLTEWGRVTVTWWSHKIKGLHRNDFIMAAKTDQQYIP